MKEIVLIYGVAAVVSMAFLDVIALCGSINWIPLYMQFAFIGAMILIGSVCVRDPEDIKCDIRS